ncbi:MAG: AAA family ATPase [Candidatus Thorarchaeota archaeon]
MLGRFEPRNCQELVLPDSHVMFIANFLNSFSRTPSVRLLILHGLPGSGKTSCINAFCNDLRLNPVYFNASNMVSKDFKKLLTVRKYNLDNVMNLVVLDEFDCLSKSVSQSAYKILAKIKVPMIATANDAKAIFWRIRSAKWCRVLNVEFEPRKLEYRLKALFGREDVITEGKTIREIIYKNIFRDTRFKDSFFRAETQEEAVFVILAGFPELAWFNLDATSLREFYKRDVNLNDLDILNRFMKMSKEVPYIGNMMQRIGRSIRGNTTVVEKDRWIEKKVEEQRSLVEKRTEEPKRQPIKVRSLEDEW